MMSCRLLWIVALLVPLLVACGGGEEKAPPTPAAPGATPTAAPDGRLSGTLMWREVTYLQTGDLAVDVVAEDELERLGEAAVGPERVPLEVFRRQGGSPGELLSEGAVGWLIWEPLALIEARRQLSQRLGLAREEGQTLAVEEVEWPDSCLGAGRPDEVCAEVITLGFRIDLAAGGDTYEYRSDRGGHVRPAP